jgi:antitoxin CptB
MALYHADGSSGHSRRVISSGRPQADSREIIAMTAIDSRIKRALYRAHHRGTKEMDLILGGFADAELAGLEEAEITIFEELLALPDDEIEHCVKRGDAPPGIALMIARIRRHHRIES